MPSPSPLLEKSTTFFTIFTNLDGAQGILSTICHPEYQHVFAPSSALGPPPRSLKEFGEHLSGLHSVMKSFPVWTVETFGFGSEEHGNDNESGGRDVTIWAKARVEWRDEAMKSDIAGDGMVDTADWNHEGEYIFILCFEKDVPIQDAKIERCVEFLDSKSTERLWELMKRARANLAATEAGKA